MLPSPLETRNPQMGTLANSEDPDVRPHNAIFYQGLHCLLRQTRSSEKEIQYVLEIITCECDPTIYKMDHHDIVVSSFMENSIGLKKVKAKQIKHAPRKNFQAYKNGRISIL